MPVIFAVSAMLVRRACRGVSGNIALRYISVVRQTLAGITEVGKKKKNTYFHRTCHFLQFLLIEMISSILPERPVITSVAGESPSLEMAIFFPNRTSDPKTRLTADGLIKSEVEQSR